MNITELSINYPDVISVSSELYLTNVWDRDAVATLIHSKHEQGLAPTFLFLGRKEAELFKVHLAEIFGEESVITLHGIYYMGLDVMTIDCDSFLATGGRKTIRSIPSNYSDQRHHRGFDDESRWQFRL